MRNAKKGGAANYFSYCLKNGFIRKCTRQTVLNSFKKIGRINYRPILQNSPATRKSSVAQVVEQLHGIIQLPFRFNQWVEGSNPSGLTIVHFF